MTTYGLDELFTDVCRKRGRLMGDTTAFATPQSEYQEVWDTMNRYITTCLEAKKGVNITNFCKIGYTKEKLRGQTKMRPFFQLSESFLKAYGIETARYTVPSNETAGFEEFNFSKAAIKFSNFLTKDNVFSGLRYVVQQIGESMAQGRDVCCDFESGKLVCNERRAKFTFVASLYAKEGLQKPAEVAEETAYKPTATFAPPTKAAFQLRMKGTSAVSASAPPESVVTASAPPQPSVKTETRSAAVKTETTPYDDISEYEESVEPEDDEESEMEKFVADEIHDPAIYKGPSGKQEAAFREAMDRYLTEMEVRASEAINDRQQWEEHVERCINQEREDIQKRYEMSKDTENFQKQQMKWNETQRNVDRNMFIAGASSHEFPQFEEPNDAEMQRIMKQRQKQMREDLEMQIRTNNALKTLERNKDRDLEYAQMVANANEQATGDARDKAKLDRERKMLLESWGRESRMRNIMRAIDNHTMSAGPNSKLLDFEDALSDAGSSVSRSSRGGFSTRNKTPKMGASMNLAQQKARLGK